MVSIIKRGIKQNLRSKHIHKFILKKNRVNKINRPKKVISSFIKFLKLAKNGQITIRMKF